MLEYDFEASLGYWVCSTAHQIHKLLGARLSSERLTLRQFEVLCTLAKLPGCGSQTEIADHLGIEPHTLAGVLKRMERDGLLERTSCEKDRRKNRVQPTKKAEELWDEATRVSRALRGVIDRGFSQEELLQLRDFCDRIKANIEALDHEIVDRAPDKNMAQLTPPPIPFSPTIHP